MTEEIILVDENDKQIGTGEKMDVHRKGQLHRCFSIFIFNDKGQVMMQKRASGKYHCGSMWTNTCCSHQRVGEETLAAAHRRLEEEMGFDTEMKEIFTFIYRAEFDNGLTEHEFDHLLVGKYEGTVTPNPEEADGYEWIDAMDLKKDMEENPERYTVWSKIAYNKLLEKYPDPSKLFL